MSFACVTKNGGIDAGLFDDDIRLIFIDLAL